MPTDDSPPVRRLWRIVKTNPPTRDDFVSHAARGETPPDDPDDAAVFDGLSFFATQPQARRMARRYPILGTFLAGVDVPLDECRVERTRSVSGHHTVWGEPDTLHVGVAEIVAVRTAMEG